MPSNEGGRSFLCGGGMPRQSSRGTDEARAIAFYYAGALLATAPNPSLPLLLRCAALLLWSFDHISTVTAYPAGEVMATAGFVR